MAVAVLVEAGLDLVDPLGDDEHRALGLLGKEEAQGAVEGSGQSDAVPVAGDESELVVRVVPRRERLILDQVLVIDGSPIVLTTPARFDPDGRLASFVILEARSVPPETARSDAFVSRLEAVKSEVCDSALAGAGRREKLEVDERLTQRRLKAIDALGQPATVRSTDHSLRLMTLASSIRDCSISR